MKKVKTKYKYAVLATDVAIFTVAGNELKILLIKMQKEPYLKHWALPGGLIEPKETAEKAARKHLHKRTGIKGVYLEQLYTFSKINRDPFGRVVSVAYFALVPSSGIRLRSDGQSAWFAVNKLPPLAYDHQEMVSLAVRRLKSKLTYSPIAYSLLPSEFTLGELQKTYEIILGKSLDKRNFRKKILASELLQKAGKKKRGGPNRPAELYRFADL